ncbi:MAG: hypothetical protein JNK49_16930, partial [Planctomycetes bacterium]|nr:hypothetical protein [Planctomycetota bacterium]
KAARKAEAQAPPVEGKKAIDTGKVRNPLLFQRLEERIVALEGELEGLREAMLLPDNYGSVAKIKELQAREVALKGELAAAYEQWENWQ